ncbi:hypothetical protein Thiowin_00508 [Thiorhodovibrio winogradskyi]|uniref:DUF4214 domain-containing protein n=1 Tax=Thiorhodovibrio winogradskyi TaxID=77007 RepID=A0ABZ0S358_9GAMM|nr:DUF4214 domain-containing protein [Thiorhodovibrio winogradskyi]
MMTTTSEQAEEFDYTSFPRRLNLGCGFTRLEGYLNVDFQALHSPDLVADVCDLSMLPADYYTEILAQDVLEHLSRFRLPALLREWNRLLEMDGLLHFRVPSLLDLAKLFELEENQTAARHEALLQCLFGTQAYPGDYHLNSFTHLTLTAALSAAGFDLVSVTVMDDWLFDGVARKCARREPDPCTALLRIREPGALIAASYQSLLGRAADAEGLEFYRHALESGRLTPEHFLTALHASPEYRARQAPNEAQNEPGAEPGA